MKPKSTKAKGNLLEDWVVKRLHDTGLDPRAYRQKGSGSGLNKGDVWNALNLCIECKNTKNFSMEAFWKQADGDSMGTQTPIVVWHPPQKGLEASRVVMNWSYFEELLLGQRGGSPIEEHPKLKYPLMRLRQATSEVLKHLPKEYE